MYSKYKSQVNTLSPVAIRLGQSQVHAPDHNTWGVVTCDTCKIEFAIGPNRIHGPRISEQECVDQFETLLAQDHRHDRSHNDSYELSD
jgi:hypothetical protein